MPHYLCMIYDIRSQRSFCIVVGTYILIYSRSLVLLFDIYCLHSSRQMTRRRSYNVGMWACVIIQSKFSLCVMRISTVAARQAFAGSTLHLTRDDDLDFDTRPQANARAPPVQPRRGARRVGARAQSGLRRTHASWPLVLGHSGFGAFTFPPTWTVTSSLRACCLLSNGARRSV